MKKLIAGLTFRLALCLVATVSVSSIAQQKQALKSASCNPEAALAIIDEHIAATRTFDDQVQRIAVLLKAADLLWPQHQEKARAVFAEAFELANQVFKEKGDEPRREGIGMAVSVPDQRFTVLGAIAKRDLAWAQKLTVETLRDQQNETEEENAKSVQQQTRTSEKLLNLADNLSASDQPAALSFARNSLRYPATMHLPLFLYSLWEVNRSLSDQLYLEALAAYAKAPMDRLLYLSSYPFGNDREVGEMPGYTIYKVPADFAPNPNLQRALVQTLLRRAEQRLAQPPETAVGGRISEAGQMWLALTRLEKQIQQTLPDLAAQVAQAKTSIFALMPPGSQRRGTQVIGEQTTTTAKVDFNEQVAAAEKNPDVDRRDQQLAAAVMRASATQDLDLVLRVIDKISDPALRPQLLNWLYFSRTQDALRRKELAAARKFAAKVDELDQRSFLYFRIAEESLKESVDQTQAREMLEEIVGTAAKAPATMVTARTQLGVAYLYTKIDLNRAIAVLAEAVKNINRIEQPDFSRQFVIRRIEGKTFGTYASFQTPGFNPENAFRELAKSDFDGTLYQTHNFTDKPLRARTSLALIEPCLQMPQTKKKAKK